jgi:lipoyl(octanoyl) transferase
MPEQVGSNRGVSHLGWCHLGRVDYETARELQDQMARERAEGSRGDLLLTLEHGPVVTLGRRAPPERERELGAHPAPLVRTERGGDVTYHGPGQLVVYPVVRLAAQGRAVRGFVAALEAALVDVAASFGVFAGTRPNAPGVWVASGAKLASIGLAIRRGVTLHGAALNLDRRAERGFVGFDPCGLRGVRVTSLESETKLPPPSCEWAAGELAAALARQLGRALETIECVALEFPEAVAASA